MFFKRKPKPTDPARPYCVAAFVSGGVPRVCVRGEGHEGMHMAWSGSRAVSWNEEGEHWWSGGVGGIKENSNRLPSEEQIEYSEIKPRFEAITLDMTSDAPVEIPLNPRDQAVVEEMMRLPFSRLRKTDEQN